MYELIVLSLLMRQPMHGYLIAKILGDIIGPFAKVSHGRLYPLLNQLERDGLVVPTSPDAGQPGGRRQRSFAITEAGRVRFRQLMLDTTSNPGEYRTYFWLKAPYLDLLTVEERRYLLDHFQTYCQAHIHHATSELHDLREKCDGGMISRLQYDAVTRTLRHHRRIWQVELEDARACAVEVLGEGAGGASFVPPGGQGAGFDAIE